MPPYLAQAYREDAEAAKVTFGSFGLVDWLESMASTTKKPSLVSVGELQYTLDFAVTGTANPSPGFLITGASGTFNLPLRRTDKNTLQIALKKDLDSSAKSAPRSGARVQGVLPDGSSKGTQRGTVTPRMMEELNQTLDSMRNNTNRLRLPLR